MQTWHTRPGTADRGICHMVVRRNEYRLPNRLEPDDLVVDIGAHIGSFAYAALLRGSRRVWAVEASEENLRLARRNLEPYLARGEVRLLAAAVWRSDANDDRLRLGSFPEFEGFPRLEGVVNTGGGSVLWPGTGAVVAKLAFDDLVERATRGGRDRVRLLKLDCEGSEWPILLTARTLSSIDEICGEFHEIGGPFPGIDAGRALDGGLTSLPEPPPYTVETLRRHLATAGFETTFERHLRPDGGPEGMGLFFARRTSPPSHPPGEVEYPA